MISVAEEIECELCAEAAIAEIVRKSTNTTHCFCRRHKPTLLPGRVSDYSLHRFRNSQKNPLSRRYAAPPESDEHQSLYKELCKWHLLGSEGACRYYLSRLTGIDQFSLWNDEFCSNVREFLIANLSDSAGQFNFDLYAVGFLVDVLQWYFEREFVNRLLKPTKKQRSIILLLSHPKSFG